ncbi:MAG: tetratricopeptide repeat protein [Flavobacteriales bacterium]|nr:tetratricopeptide repeat protein [Flavobacteriales bacterium]
MRRLSLGIVVLLLSLAGLGQVLDSLIIKGNQAYEQNDYETALSYYLTADSLIASADLDLNIGNAYYKSGRIGKAILHFERAIKARPLDEDILHNLQLARNLTLDRLEESTSSAFTLWWRGVLLKTGMDTLAWTSILLAILSALGWVYFRSSRSRGARQLGFTLGLILFCVSMLCLWMSLSARKVIESQDEAIILSSRVEVHSAPDDGSTELFVLHEGSKVTLLEERGAWTHIALPNGNKGWMPSHQVEAI